MEKEEEKPIKKTVKKKVLQGLYDWYSLCRELISDDHIHEKGIIGEIYTEARDRIKEEI